MRKTGGLRWWGQQTEALLSCSNDVGNDDDDDDAHTTGLAIETLWSSADSTGHEREQELLTETARCCVFLHEHLPSLFGLQSNS